MTEQKTQQGDLVDVITQDHRDMERAFGDYENGGLSNEQRRGLVDHIITELVRHSVAEEQYLYPAARRALLDGDDIVDHEIHEHAEAETVMKQLERVGPDNPEFERLTRQLIADVRHHVEDEEADLLPRMRRACTPEQLQELGDKITAAKRMAPTRPHPSTPDTPPANTVLDPGAGMIDRLRDALSGRNR